MTTPAGPQQPRQLMQNDPFSQPGYTDNFYDAVGGHDTFVKLIDVYPDQNQADTALNGYQLMVANDVLRGRFRNGFSNPQRIVPNRVNEYVVDLHTQDYRFLKGHRIMVQVQSSWFPLIDRNPQAFVPNIFEAKDSDFQAATMSIFHAPRFASYVMLPVESGASAAAEGNRR